MDKIERQRVGGDDEVEDQSAVPARRHATRLPGRSESASKDTTPRRRLAKPVETRDGRIIERDRLREMVSGALTMIYRVVTYDRTSEQMKGRLIVPPSSLAKSKKIAGCKATDDGFGE